MCAVSGLSKQTEIVSRQAGERVGGEGHKDQLCELGLRDHLMANGLRNAREGKSEGGIDRGEREEKQRAKKER